MIIIFLVLTISLLISSFLNIFVLFLKNKQNIEKYITIANKFFLLSALIVIISFVFYIGNLIFDNFSFAYVYERSSLEQSIFYKVVAGYSSSSGAYFLWLFSIIVILLLSRVFSRKNSSSDSENFDFLCVFRSLALFLPIFLSIVLLAGNPFEATVDKFVNLKYVPSDGLGLNPILCTPYSLFHPPFIFISFALFYIPFVAVVANLIKSSKNWINIAYNYNLYGLIALTIALLLGSSWAYNSFGWGGIWSWDPVENAVLIPFLFSFVTLNIFTVYKKTNGLLKSLYFVTIITFPLILLATFVARSGLLVGYSVHSYVQVSSVVLYSILTFLLLTALVPLFMFLRKFKNHKLQEEVFAFLSREMFISLAQLVLVLAAIVALLGTCFPLFAPMIGKESIALDSRFYETWITPLVVIYFILTGLSMFLDWGKNNFSNFANKIAPSFVLSIIFMIVSFYTYENRLEFLILDFSCFFIFISGVQNILFGEIKSKLNNFIYLANISLGLFIFFIALSSRLTENKIYELEREKTVDFFNGYKATFHKIDETLHSTFIEQKLNIELEKNGKKISFEPKFIYKTKKEPMSFPDIIMKNINDLHIIPIELKTDTKIPYNILPINNLRRLKVENEKFAKLTNIDFDNFSADILISDNNENSNRKITLKFPTSKSEFNWNKITDEYEIAIAEVFPIEKAISVIYRESGKNLPAPIEKIQVEFIQKPYVIFIWTSGILFIFSIFLTFLCEKSNKMQKKLS